MADSKKRAIKGGAQKLREKKQRRMQTEAKKCLKMDAIFLQPGPSTSRLQEMSEIESQDVVTGKNMEIDLDLQNKQGFGTSGEKSASMFEPYHEEVEENAEFDFFSRPTVYELEMFFKFHPQLPKYENSDDVPFKINKAFKRNNNSPRLWLSYSSRKNALYCTVCLAFGGRNEENAFTEGMQDWRHVYQRIDEHETSKGHKKIANLILCIQRRKQ